MKLQYKQENVLMDTFQLACGYSVHRIVNRLCTQFRQVLSQNLQVCFTIAGVQLDSFFQTLGSYIYCRDILSLNGDSLDDLL